MTAILKHAAFILFMVVFAACGNENLKVDTTQTSDNYNIAILSKDGTVKNGSGKFYIEFRNGNNDRPVDVGNVEVQATMPMPGMPMVDDAKVEATDKPGRYSVKYNLSMRGSWTVNIKFAQNKSSTMTLMVN